MILTLLIVSILLLGLLFLEKAWEIKGGKKTLLTRILAKGDPALKSLLIRFNHTFSHHREKTFFFVLVHLPNKFEKVFQRVKSTMNGYYHSVSDQMRGKRDFSSKVDTSPFIRSISLQRDIDRVH